MHFVKGKGILSAKQYEAMFQKTLRQKHPKEEKTA